MAHHQPEHLLRMVNALDCEGAQFYIHIDRKSNAAPFNAPLQHRGNVELLQNRVSTNWMGFSLVEATLRLLARAFERGFDYCLLLSGSDYPIKSNEYLFSFFESASKEFITFWKLEDRPSWCHKVEYYYFIDAIPIRGWSTNTEPAFWKRYFWGRFFKHQHIMPKRTFPDGMVPYGGPDWWSLSYGCAAYVLKFVDEHSQFKRFYKYTHSPGEMFFQTIILNSPWASRVENYESYLDWSGKRAQQILRTDSEMLPEESFNYRYIDWSGNATGLRETPAILDDRDWEVLKNSSSHFARKFDSVSSRSLLDRIDAELLGICPSRGLNITGVSRASY
jgi:hypothetical protein